MPKVKRLYAHEWVRIDRTGPGYTTATQVSRDTVAADIGPAYTRLIEGEIDSGRMKTAECSDKPTETGEYFYRLTGYPLPIIRKKTRRDYSKPRKLRRPR
jgi:hypothetical protein